MEDNFYEDGAVFDEEESFFDVGGGGDGDDWEVDDSYATAEQGDWNPWSSDSEDGDGYFG